MRHCGLIVSIQAINLGKRSDDDDDDDDDDDMDGEIDGS